MRSLVEGVWVEHLPDHAMLGLKIGTRMTVVKLEDGGLWVHSPAPLRAPLEAEVRALGQVRFLVCPNAYHHLHAAEWAKAFPEAKVHGPKSLREKRPDLTLHGDLEQGFPGLEPLHIDGCVLDETVFVHAKSRTLISSDLTENFPIMDDWFTRSYLWMNGTLGAPGWPRVLRLLYRDKKAARASVERLLQRDFDRIVIAHGELIEADPKKAIERTFTFL